VNVTPIHIAVITAKAGDRKVTRRYYFSDADHRNGLCTLAGARGHTWTKGLSIIRHDSEFNLETLCDLEEEVKRESVHQAS
jgi:hypothetical protein